MSVYSILPAKPWLPSPWYLPFQPWIGSHTSNLIWPGPTVPCTRHNAGNCGAATSDEQVGAALVLPLMAESGLAGMSGAESILVSGRLSVTRSTHAMPCPACGLSAYAGVVNVAAQASAAAPVVNAFMNSLSGRTTERTI